MAHAREGQALRRAQRENFFTHERKFVLVEIQTHDLVGATLSGWASQLGRPTFRTSLLCHTLQYMALTTESL